jgi:GNAT superfamily N-acetyltransferase
MENELEIRMADADDINIIGWLAQQIWPVAYKDILSAAQLEYMLNLIYSPDSLKVQMQLNHQFVIAELEEEPVGFASYSSLADPAVFKLQKLYVLPELHGKGLGKAILDFVTEEVLSQGAKILRLNMNRHNKARTFYERNGFTIVGEEDVDIGNNYFMNDYVMEKKIGIGLD